jgi:excisionase family DNA binding protein
MRKPSGRRRTIHPFEKMTTSEQSTQAASEFITKDEVASLIQVSNRTVSELMAAKKLPYYRFNARLIRFKKQDVLEYLERNFRVQGKEV